MNCSQALRKIKALKGQISTLTLRLQHTTSWVEGGTKPSYDYATVKAELEKTVDELVALKAALAAANSNTVIAGGGTLQQAIFRMSELKAKHALVSTLRIQVGEFKDETGVYDERGRPVYETKRWASAISVVDRDKEIAKIEEEIAALNDTIETENHRTLV
jgi:hypothetical protein